jgi:hypothetical protein
MCQAPCFLTFPLIRIGESDPTPFRFIAPTPYALLEKPHQTDAETARKIQVVLIDEWNLNKANVNSELR